MPADVKASQSSGGDVRPGERTSEFTPHVSRQLSGYDRAPADLKEIVILGDGASVYFQRLGKRVRDLLLHGGQRRELILLRRLSLPQREQRLRVALSVRGARDNIQGDDVLRF